MEQNWNISDMGQDEYGCFFAEISIGEKVLFEIQSNESAELCDAPAKRMVDCVNALANIKKQAKLAKENTENAINDFEGHTISALKAKLDHINYRLMEVLALFPKTENGVNDEG